MMLSRPLVNTEEVREYVNEKYHLSSPFEKDDWQYLMYCIMGKKAASHLKQWAKKRIAQKVKTHKLIKAGNTTWIPYNLYVKKEDK